MRRGEHCAVQTLIRLVGWSSYRVYSVSGGAWLSSRVTGDGHRESPFCSGVLAANRFSDARDTHPTDLDSRDSEALSR